MRSMKTDLRNIPGVGKSIEQDLIDIGINCVNDLKGRDPEDLYLRDAAVKGVKSDPCLLYVFRLAVYYAENEERDMENSSGGIGKTKNIRRRNKVMYSADIFDNSI